MLNRVRGSGGVSQDIGLPEANDNPAALAQLAIDATIAADIPADLGNPVIGVRSLGQAGASRRPSTAMPKVAVAEDGDSLPRKHDVGTAGNSRSVDSIPQPTAPQLTAEREFRFRVLRPDPFLYARRPG
jgi:hypothetical protein